MKRQRKPPGPSGTAPIRWTIARAETEFGVAAATIRSGLIRDGVEVSKGRGHTFTTRQIYSALASDDRAARTAKTIKETALLSLEIEEKSGRLVEMAEAEKLIRDILVPIREVMLSAPALLAARVNPTDPDLARGQLEQWVDDKLRSVREAEKKVKA